MSAAKGQAGELGRGAGAGEVNMVLKGCGALLILYTSYSPDQAIADWRLGRRQVVLSAALQRRQLHTVIHHNHRH